MMKRNEKKKEETFLALAMTKFESLTITRYTIAILKGASAGINDILEMCRHPLDQVVYPVSRLIYDATVIAAQNMGSTDPDLMLLHQYLQHHPEMYVEAVQRMHQLTHGISNLLNDFSSADGTLRTEMIAHGLTTILVPGYVIKSTRTMIQAARANHLQFGTILQPPVFSNRYSKATFESIPHIDIKKVLQSKTDEIAHYIYVLTASQELRLAKRTRDIPLKNGYEFFHHDDLAGLQSVYAAGEFYTQNGKICGINNASGHYFPVSHASMPSMVELAFQNIGVDVSGLYYAEITPCLSELINIKSKQLIDFLAQTGLSKPGCVDSLSIAPNLFLAANTPISEQTANMDDALHTQDFSVSHDEDSLEHTIGDVSHHIGNSLGITLAGLHFVKQHAPGLLHILGDIAEVIANVAHHRDSDNWVENKICGAVGGLSKITTKAAVVGSMAVPVINVETGIGLAVAAIAGGSTINEVLDDISTPVQESAEKQCHMTFQNHREYSKQNSTHTILDALRALEPSKKEPKKTKEQTPHPDALLTKDRSLCGHGHPFAESLCKISPDYEEKTKPVMDQPQSIDPSIPVGSMSESMKAMMPGYLEQKRPPQEAQNETEPKVFNPKITQSLEHQNVPSVSCVRDRLKHRFVTPHYVSKSELVKENGVLLYAITDKGKLIIARQESRSLDEKGNIMQTSHMDLTRGKKIISAGMMTVEHGDIIRMEHHAADYEPIHTESITFQQTIERIFSTYGFPEIHDKCVQRHVSHPPQIHTVNDSTLLNQKKSVSPPSLFYPQPIEISASLGEAPSRNQASSSLAPVDFTARTANFNNIIAKGISRKKTSQQSVQPTFFSRSSTSEMSTFNVSMPMITDGCSSTDSVSEERSSRAWTSKPQKSVVGIKLSEQRILAWDSDGKPVLLGKY